MKSAAISLDLNKGWQFRQVGGDTWRPAVVPGCVHSDLRREGLIPDPFYGRNERELFWIEAADWHYQLGFDASETLLDHDYLDLVAGRLDTLATVILNGFQIARTENMFVGWRFSEKDILRPGVLPAPFWKERKTGALR